MVDFFTSKSGVFAAIVAILALISVVVGLIRPVVARRRELASAIPKLQFSRVAIVEPPPYSEAGEATFQLTNVGGGKAVLSELLLVVSGHGPTELPKMVASGALVPEFTYKVELTPDVAQYDVRAKKFGATSPHSYEPSEVESFRIEIRSTEPQWYEFNFFVRWYDAKQPAIDRELHSTMARIDFLPDVTDLV